MKSAAMKMEFFADTLVEILSRSMVAPGRPLRWIIITNPTAGGFVIPRRQKKNRQALEECLELARANPQRENGCPAVTAVQHETGSSLGLRGLVQTKGPGCAATITEALIAEAKDNPEPFYLIITAGGDGTSLEVQSVLFNIPAELRASIAILRLPMGTGNDGADSPSLAAALELVIKPSRLEHTPALQLITAPGGPASRHEGGHPDEHIGSKGPYLAFNILSVGLDAFVTHMTNKMKGKLPGDFYKLWVDIASLLYDSLYKVGFLDVRALTEQGEVVQSFHEKILLLAVGASGHRTYGSQKKILPDDRNVCALRQMSLFRKVALKDLFTTGKHIDKPEANMFSAHRVEISGIYPILAQMDGETVLLQQEDFPIVIELTAPVIPVLKPAK